MFRAIKNEITTLRYHRAHAAMAASILSNIEGQKGRTSPGIITRSTDALDAFGSKIFAPWLYVYSAVSGKLRDGWVPDNYYGKVVAPRLNGSHGAISRIKSISAKILPGAPLFAPFGSNAVDTLRLITLSDLAGRISL